MSDLAKKGRGYCRADQCRQCLDSDEPTDCEMLNDLKSLSAKEVEIHFQRIKELHKTPQAGHIFS